MCWILSNAARVSVAGLCVRVPVAAGHLSLLSVAGTCPQTTRVVAGPNGICCSADNLAFRLPSDWWRFSLYSMHWCNRDIRALEQATIYFHHCTVCQSNRVEIIQSAENYIGQLWNDCLNISFFASTCHLFHKINPSQRFIIYRDVMWQQMVLTVKNREESH